MIYRDPKCVHVADSLSEAQSVAHFLTGLGLPAQVMNSATLGGHPAALGGLLGMAVVARTGVSADGLEVWVHDPAHAEPALQKLQTFAAEKTQKVADKETKGPVKAECEECGKISTFPATERDSTQDCPHCGAYMDVPE